MAGLCEMSIDGNGIWSAYVVPMFVDPTIGALGLKLSHILLLVAFDTKAEVYCIFRLAVRLMSDLEAFTSSASEGIRVYYVFAA